MTIDFGQAREGGPAWHPEPTHRGTYGLLSSCLVTMALCVWTAVHLNLPEHGKLRRQMWRKVWWLQLGLFAPELVTWTAFEQNREARAVYWQVKKALGEEVAPRFSQKIRAWARSLTTTRSPQPESIVPPDPERVSRASAKSSRRHEWTLTHSHFAIMGGFAFDSHISECGFLPDERKRVTLSSCGVVRLAEFAPHLLPDLSLAQINDKSKASRLAKTLVALQASWFTAQCVSRLALGMTVSLLELTTLAHAVCALAAYALWWDKPLDVEEPVLIAGPDADVVGAGMCMRSSMGANCVGSGHFRGSQLVARLWRANEGYVAERNQVEFGLLESLVPEAPNSNPVYAEADAAAESPHSHQLVTSAEKAEAGDRIYTLYMGQSIFGFGFRRGRHYNFNTPPYKATPTGRAFTTATSSLSSMVQDRGFMALQRPFIRLTSNGIRRLRLANTCYQKYPGFLHYPAGKDYHKSYLKHPNQTHEIWLNEYVVSRVCNWPLSNGKYRESEDSGPNLVSILLSLLIAGVAYGGIHLLAWNPPVSTRGEVLMWRISGIAVAVFGAMPILSLSVIVAGALLSSSLEDTEWFQEFATWCCDLPGWLRGAGYGMALALTFAFAIVMYVVLLGGCLLYVGSRIYLLVECIISIPHLPDSVFEAVGWSKYFPHFT